MSQSLQFLFSGLTSGAIYALVAVGFTLIYNASGVINFAQGEFVMLGGMVAAILLHAGWPLPWAILTAIAVAAVVGALVERLAIRPAGNAPAVALIIITIGASLVIRGLVQVTLGKDTHRLPAFSGETPLQIAGATLMPQSLWVFGCTLLIVMALAWFFGRTLMGKAMLGMSHNKLAAQLVGINTRFMLLLAFTLSAAVGATGGALVTPIQYTSYDVGVMLGLKGFVAATLGGLGSGAGAVAGGLLLGVLEALSAGYISSAYKDATPFVLIFLILFFRPQGLFGKPSVDRV